MCWLQWTCFFPWPHPTSSEGMTESHPNSDNGSLPQLGSYQLLRPLGSGGMSTVFQAIHIDSGSLVALKVLPRKLAQNPILLQRFLREAKSAENLDHPNIVAIYDRGYDQGRHYLVLEFVEGRDLFDRVRLQGPLGPDEAMRFVREVAEGLDYAARLGMIHRDIKPANLLITPDQHAKIIDLGLALQSDDEDERVTRDGTTVGTVDYMSPEQARDSRKINERSDIYSLGCTFYFLLTGSAPFPGGTLADKLARHHSAAPPDVREKSPGTSAELALLIQKMMAKQPVQRFANYQELILAIDQLLSPAVELAPATLPEVLIDDDDDDDYVELTVASKSAAPRPGQPLAAPDPPVISLADLAALDADTPSASSKQRAIRPTASPHSSAVIDALLEPEEQSLSSVPLQRSSDELPLQTWIAAGVMVGLLIAVLAFGVRFTLSFLKPAESTTTDSEVDRPEPTTAEPGGFVAPQPETVPSPNRSAATSSSLAGRNGSKSTGETSSPPIHVPAPIDPRAEVPFPLSLERKLGFDDHPVRLDSAQAEKITIQRLAESTGNSQITNLASALSRLTEVVEIADEGPFYEDDLQIAGKSRVIRAKSGLRAIIKIEFTRQQFVQDQPAKFLLGATGVEKLVLERLDLVADVRDLPLNQATLFLCRGVDLTLRDCSITIINAEDRRSGYSVFRLEPGAKPNFVRLEKSLIRGPIQTLAQVEAGPAEFLLDRSVIIGSAAPLFDIDESASAGKSIRLLRSLLVSRGPTFRWDGKASKTAIRALGTTFAHADPASNSPWLVARGSAEPDSKNWLDFAGAANRWFGWASAAQWGAADASATSIRELLRTNESAADPVGQESASSWPLAIMAESTVANSFAALAPHLAPSLAMVGVPDPNLLELTVNLFSRLPAPNLLEDVTAEVHPDRTRSTVNLTYNAEQSNQIDFGQYLQSMVAEPGKRYVVRVVGSGTYKMSPVRLPDGVSLVIQGPAGTLSSQRIPEFVASRSGLALLELHHGDLAMAHVGFANDPAHPTKHWIFVEDGWLGLDRCHYWDMNPPSSDSAASIAIEASARGPLQSRWGAFQGPTDRALTTLRDCWLSTTGVALSAKVRHGVIRLENCLVAAGDAFQLDPVASSSAPLRADLVLENCTILAERLGIALDGKSIENNFTGRPWLILSRACVFPKGWREGGALLGVDPNAFAHSAVFWQSSNDLYEVSRFLSPLNRTEAPPGSADLKRHWVDLWGLVHTRGDRGPDARRLDHVLNFRDRDRSRTSRPRLNQLELDPNQHKNQGVNFKAIPPLPRI